jgi:hypothetical protein
MSSPTEKGRAACAKISKEIQEIQAAIEAAVAKISEPFDAVIDAKINAQTDAEIDAELRAALREEIEQQGRRPQDEHLIPALLRGRIAQRSDKGLRAQKALAVLFLHPEGLTSEIRRELWALFYPSKLRRVVINELKSVPDVLIAERNRKIVIHVAEYMRAHGHGSFKRALEDAKKQLKLDLAVSTIRDIYTAHKESF